MDLELKVLKDEFLMYLYEISKMKMVGYIATFIQGEDALMLRLLLNGPMTPKELSNDLRVTKGRITAIIVKLKALKLIETKINEADKRSIIISLSEEGRIAFEKKLNIADGYFNDVFKALGLDDAKELINVIANLIIKVQEVGI